MSNKNTGKYLEDYCEEFFTGLKQIDVAIDRLPDTRSARNIIKAQNADFLLATRKRGACYLECKSIGGMKLKLRHFRQYPHMLRWAKAGMPGYVVAHFHELNELYLINVLQLGEPKGKQWEISHENAARMVIGGDKECLFRLLDFFI